MPDGFVKLTAYNAMFITNTPATRPHSWEDFMYISYQIPILTTRPRLLLLVLSLSDLSFISLVRVKAKGRDEEKRWERLCRKAGEVLGWKWNLDWVEEGRYSGLRCDWGVEEGWYLLRCLICPYLCQWPVARLLSSPYNMTLCTWRKK